MLSWWNEAAVCCHELHESARIGDQLIGCSHTVLFLFVSIGVIRGRRVSFSGCSGKGEELASGARIFVSDKEDIDMVQYLVYK